MLTTMRGGSRNDIYKNVIKRHVSWSKCSILSLKTDVRSNDETWSEYIEKVGIEECEREYFMLSKDVKSVIQLEKSLTFTYPNHTIVLDEVILNTKNDNCKYINEYILEKVEPESKTYVAFTNYVENTKRIKGLNEEFLDNFTSPNIPYSSITS